jgi:hypothetical protein
MENKFKKFNEFLIIGFLFFFLTQHAFASSGYKCGCPLTDTCGDPFRKGNLCCYGKIDDCEYKNADCCPGCPPACWWDSGIGCYIWAYKSGDPICTSNGWSCLYAYYQKCCPIGCCKAGCSVNNGCSLTPDNSKCPQGQTCGSDCKCSGGGGGNPPSPPPPPSPASCPAQPTSYPDNKWDRVWCDKNFQEKLADIPDENNLQFDDNWGSGSVGGIRGDDIGFRSGRTIYLAAGTYTFYLGSDDGSRLWIDGSLCIDNWGDHPYQEKSCTKTFTSPGNHQFRIDYYENRGDARIKFYYISPCPSEPPSYPFNFWDRVWCDMDFQRKLADGPDQGNFEFDEDWGTGKVGGIKEDKIGFRAGTTIVVESTTPPPRPSPPPPRFPPDPIPSSFGGSLPAGIYTFYLGSDDGSRLWIDDKLCIDNWGDHPYQEKSCTAAFKGTFGGETHRLRIDYYENSGNARVKFYYSYTPLNQPPTVSNPHETQNCCAWGSSPQVAPGLAITLHWTYSDPEGDPRSAFEIWLDDSLSFSDPKFNKVFNISSSESSQSYVLNLSDDQEGDWLNRLAWGTTYYWKVRVKDSAGNWSDWSTIDSFTTPSHASPYVNFTWSPQNPTVNQVVQFTDLSECYNSSDNIVPCSSWFWTFQNGNPSSSTKQNPTTTFSSVGSNLVTLRVTDSSGFWCEGSKTVTSTYPLPFWKEIPPFYYLEKFLASLISKIRLF